MNIISAYAFQVQLEENIKKEFWENRDVVIQEIPVGEKLIIGRNLNGHLSIIMIIVNECGGFGCSVWDEGVEDFRFRYLI